MESRVRLVALVGWSAMHGWSPKAGFTHEPVSQWEHVLVGTYDGPPHDDERTEAMLRLRAALDREGGLYEVRSGMLLDGPAWRRLRTLGAGKPASLQGTGAGAVVRQYDDLEEAIAAADAAGATAVVAFGPDQEGATG